MALQPIQTFQGAESPIVSLLQSGNATITSILDRAIQRGAQMSDRRMRQEQDMLAMRQQETALAQRRAEGLTRDITDAQRAARRAYETDRLFERSGMESDRGFDFTKTRDERDFKFRTDQAKEVSDYRKSAAERQANMDVLQQADANRRATMEAVLFDEKRQEREAKAASDEARTGDVTAMLGREIPETPEDMAAEAARLDRVARDTALSPSVKEEAAAKAARIKARMAAAETGTGAEKPMSASEKTSAMRFEAQAQLQTLMGDPDGKAFGIPKDLKTTVTGSDKPVIDQEARRLYEYQAVLRSRDEDDYVNKQKGGAISKREKEDRRAFYRSVMRQKNIASGGVAEDPLAVPGMTTVD
jgi:hypothetical protein